MSRLQLNIPLILVNFKTYLEGTGENAKRLAEIAEEVSASSGIQIIVSPQYTDVSEITSKTAIPVFAQHLDHQEPGRHTGFVLPEALLSAGCSGSMLNHAEKALSHDETRRAVERCRSLGLVSCVLSSGANESSLLASMNPDMMVIELPELIGTGRAISTVRPEVVTDAIDAVRAKNSNVVLIAGSGISNRVDVLKAIELGMQGVGASKGIVLSERPRDVLDEMANTLLEAKDSIKSKG